MKAVEASDQHHAWAERFSHDLHTVPGMEFPTTCPQCGLEFDDAQTFLDGTTSVWVGDEGVTEAYDGAGHRVVDIDDIAAGRGFKGGSVSFETFTSAEENRMTIGP